ncbi:ABC transporter permease [Lactococcus cremoris]|uniref:Multidrug ABC transporter permease n=1 Tax=Lactococcus cremoris subsp. tructae TaxID=542833 RepID=A0A2A5SPK3_LACLC|nr:ABC-2 family transporter protein [Lactococcus cremoris]PCS15871.1 multidrug ABC transporter permease [Lactococcus cremoris subsp. tructae]
MTRFFRLEKVFIKQYFKQLMEYKADFITGLIGFSLTQGLSLLFLGVLMSKIPSLKGWTLSQIYFIYGFALIPKGIDHLFTDNLWAVGQRLVYKGDFDKYMTRPLNPLLHVAMEVFQLDALGELLIGIALLITSGGAVEWTPVKILLFIVSIPFATMIYTAIKIAASSMAFWIRRSGSIMYVFYSMNSFTQYPLTIYNVGVRFVVSFLIPFAFTAYYPAHYFLTGNNPAFNIGGLVIVSIVAMTLALLIWNHGLRAYESAGS